MTDAIRNQEVNSGYSRHGEEPIDQYLGRVKAKLDYLENICTAHFRWWTHQNIAGCWICDTLTLTSVLLRELDAVTHGDSNIAEPQHALDDTGPDIAENDIPISTTGGECVDDNTRPEEGRNWNTGPRKKPRKKSKRRK